MNDLKNLIQQFRIPKEQLTDMQKSEMRALAQRMITGGYINLKTTVNMEFKQSKE